MTRVETAFFLVAVSLCALALVMKLPILFTHMAALAVWIIMCWYADKAQS